MDKALNNVDVNILWHSEIERWGKVILRVTMSSFRAMMQADAGCQSAAECITCCCRFVLLQMFVTSETDGWRNGKSFGKSTCSRKGDGKPNCTRTQAYNQARLILSPLIVCMMRCGRQQLAWQQQD